VFESANFMASYAASGADGRYVLGPPLKPVPENTETEETKNPTFELGVLAVWVAGTAQEWRKRDGDGSGSAQWADVLDHLSPLPQEDGTVSDDGGDERYVHEMELGASVAARGYGMQPGDGVDRETMRNYAEEGDGGVAMGPVLGMGFSDGGDDGGETE
jgi:hypothetical protein